MNSIHLEKIDENNFLQAFGLKLGEGQDKFVSHPIRSLAQAYVYRDQCTPFGIFCGETMVGYVMVIYDYDLEEYDIWHLMIDKEHQGRGYAKEAMRLCLEYIAGKPFGDSRKVVMTCAPENIPPLVAPVLDELTAFARTHPGFVRETGHADEDEIELALMLP